MGEEKKSLPNKKETKLTRLETIYYVVGTLVSVSGILAFFTDDIKNLFYKTNFLPLHSINIQTNSNTLDTPSNKKGMPDNAITPNTTKSIQPDIAIINVKQKALLNVDYAKQVAWSPDGKWLGIAAYGLYIYDAKTLQQIKAETPYQWVNSIAFSPDRTHVAIAPMCGAVKILKVDGLGELQTLSDSENAESVTFSPDGLTLAANIGEVVKLWTVESGEVKDTIPIVQHKVMWYSLPLGLS